MVIYHDTGQVIKDIPVLDSDTGRADITRWGADVKVDIDSKLKGKDPNIPYTVQANIPRQVLSAGTTEVKAQHFLNTNEIDRYNALHKAYLEKIDAYIEELTTDRAAPQVQLVSATRAYQSEPLASDPNPDI